MHQQRLEKFYRDHPRGLSGGQRKVEEAVTAPVSAAEVSAGDIINSTHGPGFDPLVADVGALGAVATIEPSFIFAR